MSGENYGKMILCQYTIWLFNIAMEKSPFLIGKTINFYGPMFHSYVTNNQRVFPLKTQGQLWGDSPTRRRSSAAAPCRRPSPHPPRRSPQRADVASGGNQWKLGKHREKRRRKSNRSSVFHVDYCIYSVLDVFDVVQAWVYYITYWWVWVKDG